MAVVGYARVSAVDQNLARQEAALSDVDRLFTDKSSGKSRDGRPGLDELLRYVREGDVVRVVSVDRLARSTRDLLNLLEELRGRGVAVEFLDQPSLNTADKTGEFMITVLAAVAQLERQMIRERQAEGIAAARARGVYDRGRRLAMRPDQVEEARARIAQGVPKAEVARSLGVGRMTLYRALEGLGSYGKDGER